jgi:hypothetical protein
MCTFEICFGFPELWMPRNSSNYWPKSWAEPKGLRNRITDIRGQKDMGVFIPKQRANLPFSPFHSVLSLTG